MTITNRQLRAAFLTPAMRHYFERKLAPAPRAEVRVGIEEALKFLNMASYCHRSIPVTKEIDEIWRYWILETQQYKNLCRRLQGGKFLHHRSNTYREYFDKDIARHGTDLKQDVTMLSNYVLNYGPFKKDRVRYWRLAEYCVEKWGWTCANSIAGLHQVRRPASERGARLRASTEVHGSRDR